jgi:RNA recognition motif-containing protein
MTPKSFLVSSRNKRARANPSSLNFQETWLVDPQAESLGNECPIMKIYVSNLPASTSDAGLAEMFEPFGTITSAQIMRSWDFGHSRGFGFVEMMSESGERAISKLNGQVIDGLVLRVKAARARL